MGVKEVFEIAGAVLVSTGCGGAIIFGLSSWLGKVWANRILENEKAEHSKELEKYKKELAEELEHVKSFNDKALHVSKAQYDNEYRIYTEIWDKLHECVVYTLLLYPQGIVNVPADEKEYEQYQVKKYEEYAKRYNDFSMAIDKYAPFYRKDFYELFIDLRSFCCKQGNVFSYWEIDRKHNLSYVANRDVAMPNKAYDEAWSQNPDKISKAEAELSEKIREYLLSLQLI